MRIEARENIVGFYSSGPKIRPADLSVEALFRSSYHPAPILVIIDVRPECEEIPTQAYVSVEKAVEVSRWHRAVCGSVAGTPRAARMLRAKKSAGCLSTFRVRSARTRRRRYVRGGDGCCVCVW